MLEPIECNCNMTSVSNWDKFKLLLWKNCIQELKHECQLLSEIVIALLLMLTLLLSRMTNPYESIEEIRFNPVQISNIMPASFVGAQPEMKLLYSPNTSTNYETIVKNAVAKLGFQDYQGYANPSDLVVALYNGKAWAGVQFDDSQKSPNKLSFALRFPSELRTTDEEREMKEQSMGLMTYTWSTDRMFPRYELNSPRNMKDEDGGIPVGYLREGFLPIQHAITTEFIKLASGQANIPEIELQRYPFPPHENDKSLEMVSEILPFEIIMCFVYPCAMIAKHVTTEKEKQLKEVMKIMGLPSGVQWAAWFVKSFLWLGIICLLITIILKLHIKNAPVLVHCSFTVLLFVLLLYSAVCICICFLIASLCKESIVAAAFTALFLIISMNPYEKISKSNEQNLSAQLRWSFLINTAIGLCCNVISHFERSNEGLRWSNIFSPLSVDNRLTLGYVILVMFATGVICMLICLYVEQVFPGDFGVPRKWNFPFTSSFWHGEKNHVGAESTSDGEVSRRESDGFDEEPEDKKIGVMVQNLKKNFGSNMVVKGITMNMYEDEITVLLGHNGAGKTTTISMLTGMFPPSSGTAIINGSDIRTNLDGARMSMGICPQHNVLFDDMSVKNHIVFFSRLKGLKGVAVKQEVDKYLKLMDLVKKQKTASAYLSGGMKRKLSVCCALCGSSKVVLLDEPSAGMDVTARRQLWNILLEEKKGRTILLTTHLMDEADVLGDRIAIMSGGELKCYGTPFFLKKKYVSGYYLICVKRENCDADKVTALLAKHIPNLTPRSNIGTELVYELPYNYSSVFEKMLRSLEENVESLNLDGFGISVASLEEVFLKVGTEEVKEIKPKEKGAKMSGSTSIAHDDLESDKASRSNSENTHMLKGIDLCISQWRAMFLKKWLYIIRNKPGFTFLHVFPMIYLLIELLGSLSTKPLEELEPLTIDFKKYSKAVTILEEDDSLNDLPPDAPELKIAQFYKTIASSLGPEYTFESTGTSSFTDYILKVGETSQFHINAEYLVAATVAKGKIIAWLNNQPLHTAPLTLNMVHNAIAKALIKPDAEITVTNAPLPFSLEMRKKKMNDLNQQDTSSTVTYTMMLCLCLLSVFYILIVVKERVLRSKLLQFVSGVSVWTYWLSHLICDMAAFTVAILLVTITLACFQAKEFSQFSELARFFIICFLFGFSGITSSYLISFMFSDGTKGLVVAFIFQYILGTVFVLIYLATVGLPFSEKLQLVLCILPSFTLFLALNKNHENFSLHEVCNSPQVASLPNEVLCQYVPACCSLPPYFGWESPGALKPMLYFIVSGLVFFFIVIIHDYKIVNEIIYRLSNQRRQKPSKPDDDGLTDNDVQDEKERISNMTKDEIANYNLVLDRVSKKYDKFVAVNKISLCIKHSECFGLLGTNGAGKTTTFKIMTGEERKTSGSAYIIGWSVETNLKKIYKEIGYCPQFDALVGNLTGRETLKIYCLLRGIRKDRIEQLSEELAESYGFAEHLDKNTSTYSGGNKRKLSIALAVVSSPTVIFLDEPTAGVDPAARRKVWNMVSVIRDSGKSIVLTSHSMDECEALCTRLVIMVNGEFKCIGSTQHLKNKFSKGLTLKIKVKSPADVLERPSRRSWRNRKSSQSSVTSKTESTGSNEPTESNEFKQNVKEFVEKQFPEVVLEDEYQNILTYQIPLLGIKWSQVFGLMEKNKERLNIEDYSLSQTTLENIFLEMAKT